MSLLEQLQSSFGGAYTLERELGGGAMSRVFLAEEAALGRKVVIKTLAPELAATVSTERFRREIQLAARLQHPHIVPVLSAGEAGGVLYYTMPLVEGESLRATLAREGALAVSRAVAILRDVARALEYAHGKGIVHRDIKPENVLLSGHAAVVTDFGVAKALSLARTGEPDATLTQAGTSVGTPLYMAPEQAAGDPATDHRADLYAFGCLAYELLTGAPPFPRRSPQAVLAAHLRDVPEAIGVRARGVPRGLARLVMHCLEKDPARRPASASEVLALLEPSERMAGTLRARRSALAAGLSLTLGATLGGLWWAWQSVGARPADAGEAPSVAVLPFDNVAGDTAEAYFAEGMADELMTALAKIPGLRVASRRSALALHGRDLAHRDIGRALKVENVLTGSIRRGQGRLRVTAELTRAADGTVLWAERYEREPRDVFAVQDDIAQAIANALRTRLASGGLSQGTAPRGTTDLEAYDLYLRGRYFMERRGVSGIRKAFEYSKRAAEKDPRFARAHAGMSAAAALLTWYAPLSRDSIEILDRLALSSAARAVSLDSSLAEAYTALGNALVPYGRRAEAERAYRRALALDPHYALAHQWLAELLYKEGRLDEAVAQIRRAVELDPLSAVCAGVAAFALSLAGRHEEAVSFGARAIELDSTLLVARYFYAHALFFAGRRIEAQRVLEQSGGHARFLAYVAVQNGDGAAADSLLREPPRGDPLLDYTLPYLAIGDATGALNALERAAARERRLLVRGTLADQVFDPIRDSTRFRALVRRFGLNEELLTRPPRRR
ncbi:MAG: protein kinase [Gemmatimonadaceae bacterium]